jgi:hypothetical protein
MATDLSRKVAEIAARDIGVREEPNGSNDGPRIREYRATFGLRDSKPFAYCAAAVSTWIDEAERGLQQPCTFRLSTSAIRLWEYNPRMRIGIGELTADDIPCVWIEDHGDGKGHAGIVVGVDFDRRVFQGISGNTTAKQTREGGKEQGVWADERSLDNPKLLGFLRIA